MIRSNITSQSQTMLVYNVTKVLLVAGLVYAGLLKAYPVFSKVNNILDITFLFGLPIVFLAFLQIVTNKKIWLDKSMSLYLFGFYAFCCYCIGSATFLSDFNQDVIKKLIQLVFIAGTLNLAVFFFLRSEFNVILILQLTVVLGIFVTVAQASAILGGEINSKLTSIENYQWFSQIGMYSSIIAIVGFINSDRSFIKFIIALTIIVLISGLFLGGARQSFMALLVALGYLVVTSCGKSSQGYLTKFPYFKTIFYTLLILIFLVIIFQYLEMSRGFSRISSFISIIISGDLDSSYLKGRAIVFIDALEIFSLNPFFGQGFGMFREYASTDIYRHPHNIFLEVISELGLFGLIIFSVIFAPIVRRILKIKRVSNSPLASATGALVLAQFTMNLVSGDLGTNRLLFFFAALFLVTTSQRIERLS